MNDSEIIFTVREDELSGGYTARALGYSIFTEADNLEDLRKNVKEATECYFDDATSKTLLSTTACQSKTC